MTPEPRSEKGVCSQTALSWNTHLSALSPQVRSPATQKLLCWRDPVGTTKRQTEAQGAQLFRLFCPKARHVSNPPGDFSPHLRATPAETSDPVPRLQIHKQNNCYHCLQSSSLGDFYDVVATGTHACTFQPEGSRTARHLNILSGPKCQ